METKICGVRFVRVDEKTIAIYNSSGEFYKNIERFTSNEEGFLKVCNDYYMFCY
jgi:hypothetical protein